MSCGRIVPAIVNPLVGIRSDAELLDFADRCAQSVREGGADEVLAESSRKLIIAVTALLRDWFASADYTPLGMTTLLSMALMRGKYDNATNFAFRKTPLDRIRRKVHQGRERYLGLAKKLFHARRGWGAARRHEGNALGIRYSPVFLQGLADVGRTFRAGRLHPRMPPVDIVSRL